MQVRYQTLTGVQIVCENKTCCNDLVLVEWINIWVQVSNERIVPDMLT